MKFNLLLIPCAIFLCGCDVPTGSTSGDGELTCEVEGFQNSLSTTADEMEGKSGTDLVKMEQTESIREKPEDMTDEELVEFYTNEENFVKTTHQVAFSLIVKCRTTEELVDYYLQREE